MIEVRGTLLQDAIAARAGVHDAVIVLSFTSGFGMPFEVTHLVGSTPQAHIDAAARAATMKRGASIKVLGRQIEPRTNFGAATLVLRGLADLTIDGTLIK